MLLLRHQFLICVRKRMMAKRLQIHVFYSELEGCIRHNTKVGMLVPQIQ